MGTKGHGGQAAHGPGSGRAGGGRSRLPLGSRHRPSMVARPPALDVLRPHRSWTAGAVSMKGQGEAAGRRGKGGLLGPNGPHALPEVQPRALDPGSWIPWSHSWPPALTAARDCRGQGGSQLLGKGSGERRKRVRKETHCSIHGVQGRETEEPSFQRKVCGGVSFKVT